MWKMGVRVFFVRFFWLVCSLFSYSGFAQTSLPPVNGSFWWQALKSNVTYGAASFQAANYSSDLNYFVFVNSQSPITPVYQPESWSNRSTGTVLLDKIPFASDFTLPEVTPTDTPNNPLTVYNYETGQVWHLNGAVRPNAGGPVWAYMGDATHGGSGLSGGEITTGELNQGRIPHAIAVNVWAQKFLSFAGGVGYVAPAVRNDSYASSTTYGGANPLIKMGSKLAIPNSVTASSLGVSSPDAITVLKGLQEFGAYIVDDTAWDAFAINADAVAGQRINAVSAEILKIYSALKVVTGESDISSLYALSVPGNQITSRPIGSDAGNGVWKIASNGAIKQSVQLTTAAHYRITISAYGAYAYRAWPNMAISVDGKLLQNFTVNSSSTVDYSSATLQLPLTTGSHQISIALTNSKSSRALYVNRLRVEQQP